MKDRILTGWTFRRALYLGLGGFVIAEAIISKELIAVLPGVYFASMGIFNFGCAAGMCGVPTYNKEISKAPAGEVEFEEVKSN